MSEIYFTFSISLFDSLSTTLQIILFILLLTTEKPLRNALSYLAGLGGAYFICGLLGYLALDDLRRFLSRYFPSYAAIPNTAYYQSELLTGVIMVVLGFWYFYRKKSARRGRVLTWFLTKLRNMNWLFAFGLGLFISVTSFPISVPYLIALGRYATLHFDFPAAAGWILFYNLVYALPMILILAVYQVAGRRNLRDHSRLHEQADRLNLHLTTWTMVGFGFFFMVDAGCYFAIGHALLKGRYF